MGCQICQKVIDEDVPAYCPGCTRAALYPPRIEQAKTLLEKEALARRVEVVAAGKMFNLPSNKPRSDAEQELVKGIVTTRHTQTSDALEETRLRTERIVTQATKLREEMITFKDLLAERRTTLATRRGNIRDATTAFSAMREQQLVAVKEHVASTTRAQGQQYQAMVQRRIELCRGAASEARLRRTRKPWSGQGDDKKSFEYSIGGLIIPDLREMHNFDGAYNSETFPVHVTTVFTHICRLLHLVCRYLQVRLPAEITVPHPNWPLPTIFPPSSSYSGNPVEFPTSGPNSSRSSRSELDSQRVAGRPRPLFLKKRLADLKRDDPTGYALFIEGASLLAWNVAWLCRTQGLPIAASNWEDACTIGRNLWLLLLGASPTALSPPFVQQRTSGEDAADLQTQTAATTAPTSGTSGTATPSALGQYSHGSAYKFLKPGISAIGNGSGGSSRSWIFASPVKIQHEIKAFLRNEEIGQGWEFADADEADALMDGQVQLAADGQREDAEKGNMDGVVADVKGLKGWTRVRGRDPT